MINLPLVRITRPTRRRRDPRWFARSQLATAGRAERKQNRINIYSMMSRCPINSLYIKLESAWYRLCNKENYWSRYDYDVMRNAEVLVLLKPLIQKYILYISICDACLKTNQSDASLHNLNNMGAAKQQQNISAQVILVYDQPQ